MKRFAALMLALTVFACCLGFKGRPASAAPVSAPVRTGTVLKAAPRYYTTQAYSSSVYYNNLCEVRLTGNQRLDIINAALSQVGYHEGDSTAQLNGANIYGSHNYTEYCYWYGVNVLGHSEGFYHEWCAIFTAWSARQARIPTTIINNACYAHAGMNPFYFNVVFHPRGTYVPRTGDLIFYDWAYNGKDWDHVGIVTFVQNGRVHTVEGNASDQVLQRDISIYDTEIQGYGAPFYVDSPASASEVSSYPVPAGNLSYGCSGDEVKWLQAALLHLGIPCPIDGYFGSNTLRQLKWFQYLCGMTQDGICGPNVKAAIQYALSRNNINSDDPSQYPIPTRVLSVGCTGNDVKWLQAALKQLGAAITVDGEFGGGTRQKVIWAQQRFGLTQDGVCGPALVNCLRTAIGSSGSSGGGSSGGGGGGTEPSDYPVPERLLKYGMTGDDVKWLQAVLKKNGYDMNVTGYFGDKTKNAVMGIQSRYGLTADGMVGSVTLAKLKTLVNGPGGGSSGGGGTEPSDYPVPERLLKYGMTGDDVKWLQAVLKKNGYDMNVTGYFGDKTKNAVMGIQSRYGLTADGMVGSVTLAKLKTLVNGPGGGSSGGGSSGGGGGGTEPSDYPVPERLLKYGMTGDDVKWLQAVLKKNGYDMNVTGYFGDKTKNAVMGIQSRYGLTADGMVGSVTLAKLKTLVNGPGGGSSGGGEAIPYPEPTRVLRRGMTGDDVKWLQAALKKLGYSIIVDGNFGSGTETVLKNFQSSSGLVPDGVCGPATRGALKSRI